MNTQRFKFAIRIVFLKFMKYRSHEVLSYNTSIMTEEELGNKREYFSRMPV